MLFFLPWKILLLHFPALANLKNSVAMFSISKSSFLFCIFKIVSRLVSLDTIPPCFSPRLVFILFALFLFCFLLFNASSFPPSHPLPLCPDLRLSCVDLSSIPGDLLAGGP